MSSSSGSVPFIHFSVPHFMHVTIKMHEDHSRISQLFPEKRQDRLTAHAHRAVCNHMECSPGQRTTVGLGSP